MKKIIETIVLGGCLTFLCSCTNDKLAETNSINSSKETLKAELSFPVNENESNGNESDTIVVLSDKMGNVAFLTEYTEEGFEKFYFVQMCERDANMVDDTSFLGFVNKDEDQISIYSQENELKYFFSFDEENLKENQAKAYSSRCYGIAEHTGKFTMKPSEDISNIFNVLINHVVSNNAIGDDIDCNSGGEGATECSVSAEIGQIGGGCSVSCSDGYYACCDNLRMKCKCVAEVEEINEDLKCK